MLTVPHDGVSFSGLARTINL